MQNNNNTISQTAKHDHPLEISLPQPPPIPPLQPQPLSISLPTPQAQPQQAQTQPQHQTQPQAQQQQQPLQIDNEATQTGAKLEPYVAPAITKDNNDDDDSLNSGGPGKLKKPKKKKRPTDGSKPKNKMITGYIIYASEIRKEIIKKFPGKDFGDISKIVGTEWKSLTQETKVAYEKRAQEQNNLTKMANEKAEAAMELMKLADTAVPRDLELQNPQLQPTQQDQQQQQQQQLGPSAPNSTQAFIYPVEQHQMSDQQQVALLIQQQQQNYFHQQPLPSDAPQSCQGVDTNNNNTCRTPTPNLAQHQHQDSSFAQQFQQQQPPISVTPNYPFSAQSTPPVQSYFYNYSQASNMYPQFMGQSTPIIMRPSSASSTSLNSNDTNIQQQQPMHIIQQQQQQQQQPQPQQMPMVSYCNGSCCYVNGRSPYPVTTTPNVMSSPYYQLPYQQPAQPPTTPIIYRKPANVKLKPKDAQTQTDPINFVEKMKTEPPKKILKHSKEFIEHFHRKITNNNNNSNNSNSDNNDSVELDVNAEHH